LRSVTYETLLRKARREYHARAAKWLIGASGERIGEFAGLVAAHYELAARPSEAADWYGRAGHQARLSFAPAAAIDYYRKALAPLPTPPRPKRDYEQKRLEWLGGLVEVLGAQARFAEGIEVCKDLRTLAEDLGDPIAQARGWNALSFLQERLGRNRAAVESAERAGVLARGAGEGGHQEWIRALHLKGWASYRLCDAASVLALADESLELCSAFGDRRGMATSYKLKGVAHLQLGHFQKADHFFRKGRKLYIEFGDRRNTAAMWSNLGESARLRGDCQAAVRLYESALAIARQIGHRESETIYLTNLCGARLGLGQFAKVEDDLRLAISLTSDPNSCSLAETYTFLSEAFLGQGKLAEAGAAAERALNLARESENELYIGGAWSLLGRVASALRNQPRQAGTKPLEVTRPGALLPGNEAGGMALPDPASCFAKSLEIFRKIQAKGEVARTLRAWAECDLLDRRPAEAKAGLLEALHIFERLNAVPEVERTQALLGDRLQG
jgi:tetratricopeptide (TPR) repeat protein